jgi:hypothetical protein
MKHIYLIFSLVLITACDTFWHKSSYVSIDAVSFPVCAYQAISQLEELTVNEYWKKEGRVVGQTPYSMYEISINEYGNAEVMLHGRGFNPRVEDEARVNSVLSSLTKEVANACNHS